jgi:hypothetical protein
MQNRERRDQSYFLVMAFLSIMTRDETCNKKSNPTVIFRFRAPSLAGFVVRSYEIRLFRGAGDRLRLHTTFVLVRRIAGRPNEQRDYSSLPAQL